MANEPNGNGQQSPNLAIQRIDSLKVAIDDNFVQSQLKASMGEGANSFAASIIELFSMDKYLQECDPKLVIMQALKAAVLKLPISKVLGFAYVISYKKIPQFVIGYKGLIQLAYRTAMYRFLNCDVVFEGEYKSANKLTGEFDISGEAKSDKVIGYFAYMQLHNGLSKTLYMTVEKVQAHGQRYSPSYMKDGSVWKSDFNSMGKKTVLRGLLVHWGYLSVELAAALSSDSDYDEQDRVMDEIRGRANNKAHGFTDLEVTGETKTDQPSGEHQNAGDPGETRKAPF